MIREVYGANKKDTNVNSVDECVKADPVSEELWGWSAWCEKIGRILFWLILLWGIITSIFSGIVIDKYGDPDEFSFTLFVMELLKHILYAWLEYIAYHIISILIASLATITQNTRVTAKLTEYKIRKLENAFPTKEEKVNADESTAESRSYRLTDIKMVKKEGDTWICPKCGEINPMQDRICKSCGYHR